MKFDEIKRIIPRSIKIKYKLEIDLALLEYIVNNKSTYELDEGEYQRVEKSVESNPQVLQFINKFVNNKEDVINLFRAGYCWHFAHLLQNTFNYGRVCNAYPFGHFVWLDDNHVAYDVEGRYEGEALFFVPEYYFNNQVLADFKHIPNVTYGASKQDIYDIGSKFCAARGYHFDKDLVDMFLGE